MVWFIQFLSYVVRVQFGNLIKLHVWVVYLNSYSWPIIQKLSFLFINFKKELFLSFFLNDSSDICLTLTSEAVSCPVRLL